MDVYVDKVYSLVEFVTRRLDAMTLKFGAHVDEREDQKVP